MQSFLRFLAENKVWWITPLVLVLVLVAVLLVQGHGDGAPPEQEPFVYDLY
jgi:hypothetical protein